MNGRGDEKAVGILQRGVDKFYGTIHGDGSVYDPVTRTRGNEPEDPGPDSYYTTAVGEAVSRFIRRALDERRDARFFLYIPFTAPHSPLHAHEEAIAKYRGLSDMGWGRPREERLERMRTRALSTNLRHSARETRRSFRGLQFESGSGKHVAWRSMRPRQSSWTR